jgi:hypothetical protein
MPRLQMTVERCHSLISPQRDFKMCEICKQPALELENLFQALPSGAVDDVLCSKRANVREFGTDVIPA